MTERASDQELAWLSEAIQEQRVEIREFLAERLGGDPDDYRADLHGR